MADVAPPAPAPASRSLRSWYGAIQTVTLAVFVGLSILARKFEAIFEQLEMKAIPFPTELSISAARFVRSPAGLLLVFVVGAGLVWGGLRGKFDPFLRKLIAGNVLATLALIGFYVMSVYLPVLRIEQELRKQNG